MAPLNPEVKDVKPVNPIGWSKSADVPSQFASTLSEGIRGIGNVIGLGVTAADELVKQNAQKKSEEIFRPEVDNEISRLAGVDFQMKLNQAVTSTTDATNNAGVAPISSGLGDNFVNPSEGMPPQLKELPKTLGLLDGARANGHLSESAYYGRLTSLAKDLRSQYPVGYRDYIDNQISKITGVDPANAYMKSLVGDINAAAANQQAEKNKIASKILENIGSDPINGRDMYIGFTNGTKTREQALDFIGRNEAIDVKFKRSTQEFQTGKQTDELATTKAKQAFQEWTSSSINSWIKGDLEKKGMTPQAIERLITDPEASKHIKPERWVEISTDIRQQMLTAASKLRTELTFSGTNPKTGEVRPNSYSKLLGADGSKIIDDALEPYTRMLDAIEKKDLGLLFTNQRMVEASVSEMSGKLFKDPTMKFYFGTVDAIKKHGGDAAVTQFFSSSLGRKFGTDWGNYLDIAKAELATPARTPDEPKKESSNIAQFVKAAEDNQKKFGINLPETYTEAFSLVTAKDNRPSILNPSTSPAIKQAIAQNFFSDQTRGWLNRIASDTVSEGGKKLDGKETWFKSFTRPDVVEEISRMDDNTRGQYYDWVETSYESIFGQGIKDLANVSTSSSYTVGWDNDANKLVFIDKGYRSAQAKLGSNARPGFTPMELIIDRVNSGISGLQNVYTKQGKTPDEITTKVMESLNLQIDQYRMINNLPVTFKKALDERYRVLQIEKAKEQEEAYRKEMKKVGDRIKKEGATFE